MRNIVTIDLVADKVIDIAMEEAESNSIAIKYINAASEGSSPKVEFYKPEQYRGYVAFEEGQEEYAVDVPDECINDGHIFHFRHISDKRAHKYFHITGNILKFDSMMLILTGDCVLAMTGAEKSEPSPSPDPPQPPQPPQPSNIGWVSNDDHESYKYLMEHYNLPYIKAHNTVKSYIMNSRTDGRVHTFYSDGVSPAFMWGTRKNFKLKMKINSSLQEFGTLGPGYVLLERSSGYTSLTYDLYDDGIEEFMLDGFECAIPQIRNHFGEWSNYKDVTWFDVVCFPTTYAVNGATYDIENYFVISSTDNAGAPRLYALNSGSTIIVKDEALIITVNDAVARFTYDPTSYAPTCNLNATYTNNPHRINYNGETKEGIVSYIQCSTFDVYDDAGNIVYRKDCTLEKLTTYT